MGLKLAIYSKRDTGKARIYGQKRSFLTLLGEGLSNPLFYTGKPIRCIHFVSFLKTKPVFKAHKTMLQTACLVCSLRTFSTRA
jgi:hypothetical protein